METTTQYISLDVIDDPRIAMRTELDDASLSELMADMKANGLIEPIVVRPVGTRYELVAGARRTRSARLLGWELIEAKSVVCTDEEAFAMRLSENLQRKDVDPVDEASYIGEIMLRTHKDPAEVAAMLHRSAEWIRVRLAVYEMPDYLKQVLATKQISLGAARLCAWRCYALRVSDYPLFLHTLSIFSVTGSVNSLLVPIFCYGLLNAGII